MTAKYTPKQCLNAFRLKHFNNNTFEQIGVAMGGIPKPSVQSIIARGAKMLLDPDILKTIYGIVIDDFDLAERLDVDPHDFMAILSYEKVAKELVDPVKVYEVIESEGLDIDALLEVYEQETSATVSGDPPEIPDVEPIEPSITQGYDGSPEPTDDPVLTDTRPDDAAPELEAIALLTTGRKIGQLDEQIKALQKKRTELLISVESTFGVRLS